MNNYRREEEEANVQCLGKHKRRGRRQAPSGAHKSREETENKDKRKTKDASTTRCVHINTARSASNPDTLTLPPANQDATPLRREKKNWQRKKKGEKREG